MKENLCFDRQHGTPEVFGCVGSVTDHPEECKYFLLDDAFFLLMLRQRCKHCSSTRGNYCDCKSAINDVKLVVKLEDI